MFKPAEASGAWSSWNVAVSGRTPIAIFPVVFSARLVGTVILFPRTLMLTESAFDYATSPTNKLDWPKNLETNMVFGLS